MGEKNVDPLRTNKLSRAYFIKESQQKKHFAQQLHKITPESRSNEGILHAWKWTRWDEMLGCHANELNEL